MIEKKPISIDGVGFGHAAFKSFAGEKSIRWHGDTFSAKVIYRVAASGDPPGILQW